MSQIADVTAQDEIGVIQQAAFQSKAEVVDVKVQTAIVVEAERKVAGQEAEINQAQNSLESGLGAIAASTEPAKGNEEGNVYAEVALEGAGVHPALKIAKTMHEIITDSDPAKMDPSRLSKLSGGTVNPMHVKTMEEHAQSMKGSILGASKRDSFESIGEAGAGLLERSRIQGDFTASSKVKGMTVQPEALNVTLVASLVASKRLASEQKLDQAQKAEYEKGPQMAQARQMGFGPSAKLGSSHHLTQDLASGPKFKEPTKETGATDTSSAWA